MLVLKVEEYLNANAQELFKEVFSITVTLKGGREVVMTPAVLETHLIEVKR